MNRNKFVKGLSLFLILATMLCMLTVVSLAVVMAVTGRVTQRVIRHEQKKGGDEA